MKHRIQVPPILTTSARSPTGQTVPKLVIVPVPVPVIVPVPVPVIVPVPVPVRTACSLGHLGGAVSAAPLSHYSYAKGSK